MVLSCSLLLFFLIIYFFDSLVIASGFPLHIDAFCDCIPARTPVQALGLLYRMAHTEVFCDMGNVKVFLSYGSAKCEY
jgi:hypothetical protein